MHPPGQLDDTVVDGADIDRSTTQRQVVVERLEDSALQFLGIRVMRLGHLIRHGAFGLVPRERPIIRINVGEIEPFNLGLLALIPTQTARTILEALHAACALGQHHPKGEPRHRTHGEQQERSVWRSATTAEIESGHTLPSTLAGGCW